MPDYATEVRTYKLDKKRPLTESKLAMSMRQVLPQRVAGPDGYTDDLAMLREFMRIFEQHHTFLAQMENAAMAGNTENSFSQIGVILSLLVAAIIGIMPMALSKGESLEQQSTHDASYPQKKAYIRDIMRIGMFEILISFGDLILIFGLSGLDAASKWMPWGTFAVYWLFWFLL